ncbi:MAG: carboxyl transferase domain-containing protein [Actinomycetes bacterium]
MPTCRRCDAPLDGPVPGVCPACGAHGHAPAVALLEWLVPDAASLPAPAVVPDPLGWPEYRARLADARAEAGTDESVVAGVGHLRDDAGAATGPGLVAVVWEFGFLGGSMGSRTGAVIAAAFDHAREAGLPVVLLPSTGGARMQEGMASLVQMAATTVASRAHAAAGLLQVAVLRHPTTGGVFASHANLADVVWAEPGATIGFAGPRVAEAMTGGPLPEGSHTAAGARASGLVDDVVARGDLPGRLTTLLAWAAGDTRATPAQAPAAAPADDRPAAGAAERPDAWTAVLASRDPARARAGGFLAAVDVAASLRGDRAGGVDDTIRVALATLPPAAHGSAPHRVVVVAMDRDVDEARVTPAGYRLAWRGLALAERLGLPVVTLVDTPGADASASSEAGGVAHHIAATFSRLLALPVPTVCLVTGEGGSGGALALAVADRLLLQQHATFSVIAPEGAAAILHRDAGRAPEVAALLRPTAHDLLALGLCDAVVPEPAGAEVTTAWAAVTAALDDLAADGAAGRTAARHARWRAAGQP